MSESAAKRVIVFVGGGAATISALSVLAKQPAAFKDSLDVIVIDSQEYFQLAASLQRLVVHSEKARFATVNWTDALQALGFGRFIQGFTTKISSKNKILLSDGTKLKFDYCVAATGADYYSHPWLNHHTAALYDASKKSPLTKVVASKLPKQDAAIYKSFEQISDFQGVEYAIVTDFIAEAKEAEFLQLHAALSQRDLAWAEELRDGSKTIRKFLKKLDVDTDSLKDSAEAICSAIEAKLRTATLLWGSRGLFRDNVSDGQTRSRQWRLDQLALENRAIAHAEKILILGGGEVSIETAADIAERYGGHKVTILHTGKALLDKTSSARAHRNLKAFIKQHGIEVILNQSMKSWRMVEGKYVVELSNGDHRIFSKIIVGYGGKARSQLLKEDFGNHIDNNNARVNVDANLRLTDTIFIAGDLANVDNMTAFSAGEQGKLIGKNIVASIQGKPLGSYKKAPVVIMVSLGSQLALFIFNDTCVMASQIPLGMKLKAERETMKLAGQTESMKVDWSKEFSKASKQSKSTATSVEAV